MSIKSFFTKVRELWKIPKFRGIIQLSFWIIFFVIIAMIFHNAENSKIEEASIKNEYETITSYEYNYQYQQQDNIINISGTAYKEKQVFYMNNVKYYYINNNYYLAQDNSLTTIIYALNEWQYDSLKNIMDNNDYSSKLEYEDSIKYEYNISYLVYNNYYGTNYQNDIIVTIILNDDLIESAIINYEFATVNIEYTNINKIKDLDINID